MRFCLIVSCISLHGEGMFIRAKSKNKEIIEMNILYFAVI